MTDDQIPSGREVLFTLARGYRKPLILGGVRALVFAVIFAFVASFGIAPVVFWVVAAVFGAFALLYAIRYVWAGRFRTRLSAEGIEIRGYFSHFVPWQQVTGLEVTGHTAPARSGVPRAPYLSGTGQVNTGYATVRSSGRLGRPGRRSSTAGYRGKLFTVRVARSSGHSLLLRAPLVTAWQSDPQFEDKVRVIDQWRSAYGKRNAADASG